VPGHVFGPVPSRRLGRSLGVDLVPFKTCSYDCVYCQLGPTTERTLQRREWVPLAAVLGEVENALGSEPDYITLSGSGEPTLYSKLGELIAGIKRMTSVPVAVLTNGSLLWSAEVRESLANADLVVPSLDAGSQKAFELVNRPHPAVDFGAMVEGLMALASRRRPRLWLEVLVVDGINASPEEVGRIAGIARQVRPEKVQLNTVTRPPTEEFARPVSRERMERFAAAFDGEAEVIADYRGIHARSDFVARREDVLGLLRRRPCTVEDIAAGLGLHRNEVVKYVEELTERGDLLRASSGGRCYYYRAAARPEAGVR
jgi:wyosine [tRNA(Phe)-imidazoG37] synthetase (radical SAM superfamily)